MIAISRAVRPDRDAARHARYRLAAFTAFLICLAATPASAAPRTVRVGIYQNEPKIFVDENGRPSGIFVDLLESIAEEEGWDLEYVPGDWSECLSALESGTIDLMPDVAYSAQRDRLYDFHQTPVVQSWSYVYARPGLKVQELSDLAGKRVAVLKGSIQQTVFGQMAEGFGYPITLVPVGSLDEAFEAAADGSADAAIANHLYGDYFYRRSRLVKTPIVFNPVPLHFATTQGSNHDLLDAIDRHLTTWIGQPDSPYYHAFALWMAVPTRPEVPAALYWALAVIGTLLFLSAAAVMVLRWQVAERTAHLEEARADLEDHRLHLEELVEERTRELEEANAAKSRFLARMSHELRTPLNSIIGFSSVLSQGMCGPLAEEQRSQVDMIHRAGKHLLDLIDSVLDLSQIETGTVRLHLSAFDGADVLSDVAETMRPLAAEKGLDIRVSVPDTASPLFSDGRKVRQILLNLVGNAVKYTERGSISVGFEPRSEGRAVFTVSDTGSGIPEDDLGLIFDPFHQAKRPDGKLPEGAGLGLAISQDYARMLGGRIVAENREGGGATFTLLIPQRCPET